MAANESGELYARVGWRDAGRQYPIRIAMGSMAVPTFEIQQRIALPVRGDNRPSSQATTPPGMVAGVINEYLTEARKRGIVSPTDWPKKIRLDVASPDFYGVDWEDGLHSSGITCQVTRFRPVSDPMAPLPFDLPA